MNKIVIALIAVVIIGTGAVFVISGLDDEPAAETASNNQSQSTADETADDSEVEAVGEEVVITYQDGRFEPEIVTVTPGSRVTFVNESDTDFWPASDDHPIHNDLPDFDSERSLGPGEEYSHVFEEPGEWTYHNHLDSFETGTINVSGL